MARGGLTAVLVLLLTPRASETSNPYFKILSYYDTVFEDQKSLLTLAIAENAEANQFFRAGVPSLAPLDNIASAIYKRGHTATGGSVLLPGWEKGLEAWHKHLKPSLDNGTIAGIFIGDEICCHLSVSCWDSLLNPLAEKLRALLGPDKILYTNECGDAIAGRNCYCDPRSSPTCGGCDAGHPGQGSTDHPHQPCALAYLRRPVRRLRPRLGALQRQRGGSGAAAVRRARDLPTDGPGAAFHRGAGNFRVLGPALGRAGRERQAGRD